MSFQLTHDLTVKSKNVVLPDGEYSAIVTKVFKGDDTSLPYIQFTINGNCIKFLNIVSEKAFEYISGAINTQLDVEYANGENPDPIEWLESLVGAKLTVWLLTESNPENGKVYQNVKVTKPTGFDAIINGAL